MAPSKPKNCCKTCTNPITARDAVFLCVSCGDSMHLTPKCTEMSERAIFGISEVSQNLLLICNACVRLNHRDRMLDKLASTRENNDIKPIVESVEEVKNQLQSLTSNISNVKGIKDQITSLRTEMAPRPDSELTTSRTTKTSEPKTQKKKENYDGLRVRGIAESKAKSPRERYEHDVKEVKSILEFLKIDCPIDDLRRLGNYDGKKDRTLIIKTTSEHHRRLILLSLYKLKTYSKQVYMSKELSPEDQKIENDALKLRRKMIENDYDKKRLRIRNLKLQQNTNETDDKNLDNWENVPPEPEQ